MVQQEIRNPAVAGKFYPAHRGTLRKDIQDYLQDADPPDLSRVRAVIVPHAGYPYSGPIAAFAYKLLTQQPTLPRRILLLGPAHYVGFPGVALADVVAFRTPLGDQPVDRRLAEQLSSTHRQFITTNAPHAPEHSLEVQYPFLQLLFPNVPTVPMLFGQGVDAVQVGEILNDYLEPGDWIIVSSDLSHYLSNERAHIVDRQFLDALLQQNKQGVAEGEACGQAPALTLMTIAEKRGWQARLLDYRTSGDVIGDTRRVVGYAAIAYTEDEDGD